jgi:single-strand DNA-binding protein
MSVRSLNKVLLIGNLTKDPVVRFTPTGTAVASFSLATNRSWTPSDGGEKQEKAEYHNIVAWTKLAELCGQLLHKGDKVYVEGRLQTREWKSNDGQDRRTTEVVIENMILLNTKGGAGSYSGGSYGGGDDQMAPADDMGQAPAPKKRAAKKDNKLEGVTDDVAAVEDVTDDIPF